MNQIKHLQVLRRELRRRGADLLLHVPTGRETSRNPPRSSPECRAWREGISVATEVCGPGFLRLERGARQPSRRIPLAGPGCCPDFGYSCPPPGGSPCEGRCRSRPPRALFRPGTHGCRRSPPGVDRGVLVRSRRGCADAADGLAACGVRRSLTRPDDNSTRLAKAGDGAEISPTTLPGNRTWRL